MINNSCIISLKPVFSFLSLNHFLRSHKTSWNPSILCTRTWITSWIYSFLLILIIVLSNHLSHIKNIILSLSIIYQVLIENSSIFSFWCGWWWSHKIISCKLVLIICIFSIYFFLLHIYRWSILIFHIISQRRKSLLFLRLVTLKIRHHVAYKLSIF